MMPTTPMPQTSAAAGVSAFQFERADVVIEHEDSLSDEKSAGAGEDSIKAAERQDKNSNDMTQFDFGENGS